MSFENIRDVAPEEICARVSDALRRKACVRLACYCPQRRIRFIPCNLASLSVQGQTPDALFDALATALVSCQWLCRRYLVDGKIASWPKAAGGQEVRWPDFRALFAQLEHGPLRGKSNELLETQHEPIRPSLGEGQLQQLASRGIAASGRGTTCSDRSLCTSSLHGLFCAPTRLWITFDTNADGGISREDLLSAVICCVQLRCSCSATR